MARAAREGAIRNAGDIAMLLSYGVEGCVIQPFGIRVDLDVYADCLHLPIQNDVQSLWYSTVFI